MTPPRKPMNFNLGEAAPIAAELSKLPPREKEPRQQVGARIPAMTYRKLKARAALQGEAVQSLVERAIEDFLAKSGD
jgi:hypothetical protein